MLSSVCSGDLSWHAFGESGIRSGTVEVEAAADGKTQPLQGVGAYDWSLDGPCVSYSARSSRGGLALNRAQCATQPNQVRCPRSLLRRYGFALFVPFHLVWSLL